jgi:hypothetical protein
MPAATETGPGAGAVLRVTEYLCASALDAGGAQLLRVEAGAGGGRCAFVFDDRQGRASALLRQHRGGVLKISSRDMAQSVHRMKDEIFGARR